MNNITNAEGSNGKTVVDVRYTMSKLPKFLQWFLTWLTGKPLGGQKPLIRRSNLSHLFTAYLVLVAGCVVSIYSIYTGAYLLYLPAVVLIVSGARKLIPTINHYCVHKDLLPASLRKKYSWMHPYIADFNSSILCLQDFKSYKAEHLAHHDIKNVASIIDPDMGFMWQLGFKAGMTKPELWRKYLWNLLFPFSKLHRLFVKSRTKTIFFNATPFRVIVQLFTFGILAIIGWYFGFAVVFFALVLPMTYFYHIASLMQFSSEHLWLSDVEEDGLLQAEGNYKGLMNRSKRITNARFCGEAIPNTNNDNWIYTVCKWCVWVFRMVFVHLFVRLFVLPGDLVVHDWHHRCGFGADWANGFYARAEMAEKIKDTDLPLTEVWGLYSAIDAVFENFAKMQPINPALIEMDNDAVLGM